jgi:magnesium transporter
MSNTLNMLMKFLSSISLILASSGLIAELWGMNTGGLPFESNDYGTLIMIFIAFIAGLSMYIYLRRKNFF